MALLGGIYLVLVAPRLLPDRGQGAAARYNVAAYLAEVQVTANSPLVGKPLAEVRLPERYHTAVVLLRRNGMEAEPDAETRLEAGDVLVLTGDRTKLLELASLEGVTLAGEGAAHWGGGKKVQLYEVLITPRSALVGRTISDARFRSRYGGTVLALRKRARVVASHQPLARAHLDAGDALLVAGIEEDKRRVRLSDDVLLVEELGGRPFRREKAWIALLVMAGVVAVAAVGFVEILVAAIAGAALMAILGVLHMEELHAAIRWDVLFLLAGVIPLGIALERSGLAAMMAGGITAAGYFLPALAVLILVYGITTLLTEVMSNNAAVVLLAPIAAATAMALDLNPKTFLLAVTFAASTAFLTPVGYQTNTLVYGPGGYRFSDYARVGLPLNLLLLFATPVILDYFFPLYG